MQINKNRKGLALGAVFALVAGLFGGAAPASATVSTSAFTFTPAGGTSFAVINVEDFHMFVQRNPSVVTADDFNAMFKYSITTNRTFGTEATGTTYSVAVVAGTASGALSTVPLSGALVQSNFESGHFAQNTMFYAGNATALNTSMPATVGAVPATQSYVVFPSSRSAAINNFIGLQVIDANTYSPTITVDVTAFLDLNGNNIWDAGSEPSATQRVTLLNGAAVSRTVTVGALESGDTSFTASATLTGLNTTQMSGKFALKINRFSNGANADSGFSYSNPVEVTLTESPTGVSTFTQSIYTTSAAVAGTTVSAQLLYVRADGGYSGNVLDTDGETGPLQDNDANLRTNVFWPSAGTVTVAAAAAGSLGSLYVVEGDNAKFDTGSDFDVRPNTLVTVVASFSAVASTSAQVATFRFTGVTLDATKTLSVNGGAAQNTATHSAVTATINATTGVASITLLSTGFGLSDTLTVHASTTGVAEDSITLDTVAPAYTLTQDATDVATAPATAVEVGVTVKDQFGVKSARSDQRIRFYWSSGYSGTATNSFVALVAGSAEANMTPSRTPVTGSAVVSMQLQYLNGTVWTDQDSAVTTNVIVTSATNSFRKGLAASYSASISYGAAFSWSDAIDAAYVVVTGSQVVVSGPGLMFKDANDDTASDSITLPGNSTGQVTFHVTARKAGSYPITLTAGTATTTSLIVVSPARSDAGASFTWDTTAIEAGKTRIVVGTLVDANGNPVDTTGPGTIQTGSTASILVSFTGTAGLVIGTLPTETDADGKFQVSVLTSAADRGTLNLSASFLKAGAATAVADVVTSVASITVGAGVAAPASDQKLTVGSFKGYVAIYALNYTGQKLSAKVAGKWLVVEDLIRFQRVVRNTGAGYTIKVDLYIDGAFVRSETIVTK